jgi:hypothetical protein
MRLPVRNAHEAARALLIKIKWETAKDAKLIWPDMTASLTQLTSSGCLICINPAARIVA